MSDREDRIKGVLLGMAAGDALGAGYETGKRVPQTGATMCGGGFGFAPGEFTDDTQQAVCVALARSDPAKVAVNLMAWFRSPGVKDIGGQTRAVLGHCITYRGMVRASRAFANRAAAAPQPRGFDHGTGNGSLMRTGPVCLPYLGDRKRIAKAARQVSDLTHADPWSGDACVLWSLAIDRAIELGAKFSPDMVADGLDFIPRARCGYWQDMIADGLERAPWLQLRRNGGAVGCFRAALAAVSSADSLEEGLRLAVGIGGDTDTVAAVAGALLGAIHGASSVPARWRSKIWGWPGRMRAADLEKLALSASRSR